MEKKLILVASPPACGKTYVSQLIANKVDHAVYLDKDDLCELLRAAFSVAGREVDMDGDFYLENLRPAEYATILYIAFSTLRFADRVILNGPFGKEVRDTAFMRELKEKANENGAALILVWVTAPIELCYERMKTRNSDRDVLKLAGWDSYVKKTDYTPPYPLEEQGAVDGMIIFDTRDDVAVQASLEETLKWL